MTARNKFIMSLNLKKSTQYTVINWSLTKFAFNYNLFKKSELHQKLLAFFKEIFNRFLKKYKNEKNSIYLLEKT